MLHERRSILDMIYSGVSRRSLKLESKSFYVTGSSSMMMLLLLMMMVVVVVVMVVDDHTVGKEMCKRLRPESTPNSFLPQMPTWIFKCTMELLKEGSGSWDGRADMVRSAQAVLESESYRLRPPKPERKRDGTTSPKGEDGSGLHLAPRRPGSDVKLLIPWLHGWLDC